MGYEKPTVERLGSLEELTLTKVLGPSDGVFFIVKDAPGNPPVHSGS